MTTSTKLWVTVFVVAAFAVCAGFVAGSMLGMRERRVVKATNQELLREASSLRQQKEELATQNEELSDHLERLNEEIERSRSQSLSPPVMVQRDDSSDFEFEPNHDRVVSGVSDAEQRLAELECEIAALRELVSRNAQPSIGPPSPPSPSAPSPTAGSGTALANAANVPTVKEQCTTITKKGIRCSRPARSNGKCWQHGG